MNFGQIISRALVRAKMPVSDAPTRQLAKDMLNELLQEHWNSHKWWFRVTRFNFNTSGGVEEYVMNKNVASIMLKTMRGTEPVRQLNYQPRSEFYDKHPFDLEDGTPYWYRIGEMYGVQANVSAASTISISSSLSNYTTGTVTMVYGSNRVIGATTTFTIRMVGQYFLAGSDTKRYRIKTFISTTEILLEEAYEGASGSSISYAIGDLNQEVSVTGVNSTNNIFTEVVRLNGSTAVVTNASFSSLIRITKNEPTFGVITATSSGGGVTNIRLDPGEHDADFITLKFYPIPTVEERIEFEGYQKHPFCFADSDSVLFPNRYHNLFVLDLFIRLKEEFLNQEVSANVIQRRNDIYEQMLLETNDSDEWDAVQESETRSIISRSTNLPDNFGVGYNDEDL